MSTLKIFNNPRDGYVLVAEQGRIGRLSEESVTICGFTSRADAVTAAAVAVHALRAHLAERDGTRLDRAEASGETASVSVYADGDRADGSFCFELQFPSRLTELGAVRAARAIHAAVHAWTDRRSRDVSHGEGGSHGD